MVDANWLNRVRATNQGQLGISGMGHGANTLDRELQRVGMAGLQAARTTPAAAPRGSSVSSRRPRPRPVTPCPSSHSPSPARFPGSCSGWLARSPWSASAS